MIDLVVLGSGNADIIRLIENINENKKQYNFVGFLEKDISLINTEVLGYPIIGTDDLLLGKLSNCAVINNIMGSTQLHKIIAENIYRKYYITNIPNLVHPNVSIKYAIIGKGNIFYNNVGIAPKVKIGDFNIIYPSTNIGHETVIGNYNLFALNVNIGARCKIGDKNLFGNSSTLSLGLKVNNDNSIGVGSVVIKNIDSDKSLLGNPAIDSLKLFKYLIKNNLL
jgi:UDP-3-O-[3-hydroxymyristoyl] glucosamine N-acyltransferase